MDDAGLVDLSIDALDCVRVDDYWTIRRHHGDGLAVASIAAYADDYRVIVVGSGPECTMYRSFDDALDFVAVYVDAEDWAES